MAWPAVGIVGGGEASAAAQPAMGGRSMRHDQRCFGRLEQQDQRFKKHYGRWMDIVRSLELESFILTKLTKHSVPVNLVGHKSASHRGGSQLAGGVFIFVCVDHAAPSASKVVDYGEAPDSNEPEMGRRGSRVADGRCKRVNWF